MFHLFLQFHLFSYHFACFCFFCLDWYRYEGRFFGDPNNEGLTIDFDRDVSQTINEEEEEDVLSPELERLIAQEKREMKPHQEETELVNLGTGEGRKEVKVGTSMTAPIRQDMLGLDSDIVQHKLPLNPGSSPVKQKLRRMRPEMSLKIKEEVRKQFDAGFLAVARYPEWVANIVPVPKKDDKVRMCVDYRDLN